ncbi:isoamylase early set domain-containing protein [Alteromonas sp. CYL-A6]|uniref:isoamylase early set domain-containing protein n=1 Tax=Alteromonas nitratireducens TaxID=3390813 RepID=UPI0034A93E7C
MSIKKQYLKSKPVCKVTFRLRAEEADGAKTAKLVGDFNDWDLCVAPMKKLKSGDFTQTLDLPADRTYQFRYLLDDEKWENDWQADGYQPSPVAWDDNSVVRL